MATLSLSTANPRLQSPSLAKTAEDGSDHAVVAPPANAFATMLDQLDQATSTPSPVIAASTAALPAPPSAAVPPAPTPLVSPAAAATDPIGTRAPVQKNGGKTEAGKDGVSEDAPHDLDTIAQPDAPLQPAILPIVAALPFSTPFMTAATGPGDAATSPLPEQPAVGLVPSSAKPIPIAPLHQPSADTQLLAETAPQQSSDGNAIASPVTDKSTADPAPASTPPGPQAEPTASLERAMTAQSRIGPASPSIQANGTAAIPDDLEEAAAASTPNSSGTKDHVSVATPSPVATVPPPIPSLTASPVPAVPPPASRLDTDQPVSARAAASASTSSKSTQAEAGGIVLPPPTTPLDTTPTTTPAPPALAMASAAQIAAPRPPDAKPPTPAAQVATALVEPVEIMLSRPSPANPTEPHVTTIQITPVELGRVDIRIERPSDGPAKIELVAERPETLSRLVHEQSVLHQALDQAGLAVGNRTIEFSLAPVPTADNSSGTSSGALNNGTAFGDGSGGSASHRQGGRYPNQGFATDDTGSSRSTTFRSVRSGIDITA